MIHGGKILANHFTHKHLNVWLNDACIAGGPSFIRVAACHVGEIEIIVGVIDQICVKCGLGEPFEVAGFVCKCYIELFAFGRLLNRQRLFYNLRSHFLGGRRGPGCGAGLYCGVFHRFGSRGLPYYHTFADEYRCFKTVLVLHISYIVDYTVYHSASYGVEKPYHIAFLCHSLTIIFYCYPALSEVL